MKKFSLFFFSLFCFSAFSQEFVADNVEFIIGEKSKKKTKDRIRALNSDVFLASHFGEKKGFVRMVDAKSMEVLWMDKVPKELKHQKLYFDPDTAFMSPDGVPYILCSSHDRRSREVIVAVNRYTPEGTRGRFFEILRAPANSQYEYEVYHMATTDKFFVFGVFTGIEEKDNKWVHLYWFDHDFKEVKHLSTEMHSNSYELESSYYDHDNDVLVFSSFYKPRKIDVPFPSGGGLRLNFNPKDYVVYRGALKEVQFVSKVLDNEGIKLYSNQIVLDTKKGVPYLFGLSGPKSSNKINNIYAYELSPVTLEIVNAADMPISAKLVDEIKDTKYGWIKVMRPNTVSFHFSKAVFSEDRMYVVFDDAEEQVKYGQLVIYLDKRLDLKWYTYFHSYGCARSYSVLDNEGNLRLYNLVFTSVFQKQHEGVITADYPKINYKMSFVETKFSPINTRSIKELTTFYHSQMKIPMVFIDAVSVSKNKIDFFFTRAQSLNSSQEKRHFQRITVRNPDL